MWDKCITPVQRGNVALSAALPRASRGDGKNPARGRWVFSMTGGMPVLRGAEMVGADFLQFAGEGFDVRAPDCRAQETRELFRIVDGFDLFTESFGN